MKNQADNLGKGVPGRDLEKSAEGQAETTGGLNLPGTDVNREATQGDSSSGHPEAGASISVGDDHLLGPEQLDMTFGGPLLDTSYLESLFEDMEFPAAKADVLMALERRGDDHPISGVDIPDVIGNLEKERFMNPSELVAAVRGELERRAHTA